MEELADGSTEVTGGLVIFGLMSVTYDGRASSTLDAGYYLLVRKPDGSTMVHGGDLTTPLNYQPSGSRMFQSGWTLTVVSKHEKMIIEVIDVQHLSRPKEWSANRIRIVRTERELRDKLADNFHLYVPGLVSVHREMPSEYGPMDLVGIDGDGTYHVVELKRTRITISAAVQLRKYLDAVRGAGHTAVGYLAAPSIVAGAQKYCERQGYHYIPVQHRDGPV